MYAILAALGVSSWTIALIFPLVLLAVICSMRRPQHIPPGPPFVPILGNLLSLASRDILATLRTLRGKYGDIYGLYIGSELMIYLNGYDVIHEALKKKGSVFGTRPMTGKYEFLVKHPGIVFENGRMWKEQRRFAQDGLSKICFMENGQNVDGLIKNEAACLVAKLSDIDGPCVIDDFILVSSGNVMTKLLIDQRFDFGNKQFLETQLIFQKEANVFAKMHVLANCIPFLHKLPGDWLNMKYLDSLYTGVLDFLHPFQQKHRECSRTNDDVKRDLVGLYIEHQKRCSEPQLSNIFSNYRLQSTCADLLAGSTAGIATTIRWILLYLIRDPSIQEKMYAEISQAIGNTPPSLVDRKSLVFTEAVVLEGLRIAPVAPLAVPHAVSQDTMFRNYLIPRKSTVVVNLESVLKDPSLWTDPEVFRPERFLNDDETELVVPEEFIPFSVGPRACMGETLARMQLFLFMASLVQAFEFRYPTNAGELPGTLGSMGLTYTPKSFPVECVKR